jgi:N,N'-diacetyllegionaminate synthase
MSTEIIVEIGNSHEGSLGIARSFIDMAKSSGAEIVKFQMHMAKFEGIASEPFRVSFSHQDKTRADYWDRVDFTDDGWRNLSDYCDQLGIEFMCTPFSVEAAKRLLKLTGIRRWKVGSGDAANLPLLDFLVSTDLPLIISTGLISWEEILLIKDRLELQNAWNRTTLMHCVSMYPTPLEFSSLNILDDLKTLTPRFGLSDHSGDLAPGIIGITKGVRILEVHMAPHEMFFGPDVSSSLSHQILCQLVRFRDSFSRISANSHSRNELLELSKETSRLFRKGIYWAKDQTPGEIVDLNSFSFLKPSSGVDSIHFESFLGKKLARKVQSGMPFLESDVHD